MLCNRQIPQRTIASSFHVHPFFREYSANFWLQIQHEAQIRTIQETTIVATIDTLSDIHDVLAECLTDVSNGEVDRYNRDRLIFDSAAVHLWNFKTADILPHRISEVADLTVGCLQAAHKRLLSCFASGLSLESDVGSIKDWGWLEEGSNIIRDEAPPTVTSPSPCYSSGELVIEVYDS